MGLNGMWKQALYVNLIWVRYSFVRYRSGKDGTAKEYYTLECLLFILKNINLTHPVYVRQAAAENIPIVHRPDRKELLAYLNGETASCPAIDKSAPLELPTQVWQIDLLFLYENFIYCSL